MKLSYYGHSCFGLHTEGVDLLFDPFINGNELAKHIDVNSIPADFILASHAHEDHVADLEAIAKRTNAKIIGTWEIVTYYAKRGLDNGHPMNFGGKWDFDFGTVHFVQAIHSSSFADGTYGGSPGGFIIETGGMCIYYSGDTALSQNMKLLGEKFKIDLALLCIGDNFTMGVDDAIKAADFVNCNHIIGMHYDTFGFITIDHNDAILKFKNKNKHLTLMEIGSTIKL